MLKLKVNEIEVEVEEGLTVLQACEKAGVEIPWNFYSSFFASLKYC